MYSRQQKKVQNSASQASRKNQFAAKPFIVQPKFDRETPDSQPEQEQVKPQGTWTNASMFTYRPVPKTPTVQRKLNIENSENQHEQEPEVVNQINQIPAKSLDQQNLQSKTKLLRAKSDNLLTKPAQTKNNSISISRQLNTNTIQRGIKKPGKTGEIYTKAPASFAGERFNASIKKRLQEIIDNDEKKNGKDYTLTQAVAEAKRDARAQGHFITGRIGKRVRDYQSILKYFKSRKADVTTTENKMLRIGAVIDAALNTVEVMEDDFQKVSVNGSADQFHRNFISTFTTLVPSLTPHIEGFNQVAKDMVTQGGGAASSLKGSMFETWALQNVLPGANKRVSFDQQGKMTASRISDGYDSSTKTLWDMKHYFGHDVPQDQAEDYNLIVQKGYEGKNGEPVRQVNYLFPSQEGAKKNEWLNTSYGFGIYYIDSSNNLKQHK
ncbi:MAG TPA: hypothetical protein VK184_00135 [Nostocaceae cyanobacterium]|nr:hypothetical protein [Nostocaceae cyanobacterium]